MRCMTRILAVLLPAIVLAASLFGQSSGSIVGTVKDTSGGILAGASVTAANLSQGVSQTVPTNEEGIFVFPQLPSGTYSVTVELAGHATVGPLAFHPSTLRRAVLNVVQNAIEAMPNGGTLRLACVRTATAVQLHIRDSGVGIPAALVSRIFEPLYTTKPGGTGLGLYIVREILVAHGGGVTVDSVEGQGTTFVLTFPVPG